MSLSFFQRQPGYLWAAHHGQPRGPPDGPAYQPDVLGPRLGPLRPQFRLRRSGYAPLFLETPLRAQCTTSADRPPERSSSARARPTEPPGPTTEDTSRHTRTTSAGARDAGSEGEIGDARALDATQAEEGYRRQGRSD